MTTRNTSWLIESVSSWFRDVPRVTASQWACQSFTLSANEGRGQGPFSLHGRQYLREIIDGFSDPYIEDIAACLGTQIGKTASIQAGVAYLVANDPCGILWVLPTTNDSRNFSAERWMRNVMASPELRKLVPTGAKRFDFAKANQQLGGTHIAFAGSNSPSGLAGRPRRVVILDEMEKFPTETRGGEAGSINLACQRTKDAAFPKRIRTSSPAMIDGPGWSELMKGDVRRRYVPCPGCGRFVILAWSKDHTELRITGDEAWMVWDKEARSEDGRWDYDRVERSARFECPGCGHHIREEHKLGLDAKGEWRPTQPAPKTWRSYHLPSWYAPSPSTTFGLMAVSFLQSLHGLEGLHGWLNGNAAEPWTNQSGGGARVEVITTAADAPVAGETVRILTVDCQQTSPHFYWAARDWAKDGAGHSRLVEAGTCESWEDLRGTQVRLEVGDNWVGIDSGWQATRVYQECLRWGSIKAIPGRLPVHLGWLPMKGREGAWSSKDKDGNRKLWGLGSAALERKVVDLKILEFSGDQVWTVLEALRRRQGQHGIRWEAVDSVPDGRNGYWSQMDAKHSVEVQNRRTGRAHIEIHKHKGKQDHWLDCELEQIAFAMMRKLLPWSYEKHGRTTVNQGASPETQAV
jgi:ribosomal protein S27AE